LTRELQSALDAAKTLPPEQLPRLLGDLREVEATALARLAAPANHHTTQPHTNGDDTLDVDEAARYIGMSTKWLYRNHAILPSVRIGCGRRPRLRFRRRDLDVWLQQHTVNQ
jgi:predicted DNA-binding transcriptional regulator AlpA